VSLIKRETQIKNNLKTKKCEKFALRGGDGKIISVVSSKVTVNLQCPNKKIIPTCDLFVTPELNYEVIIGYDIIKYLNLDFNNLPQVVTAASVHSFSLSSEPIEVTRIEATRKPFANEIVAKKLTYLFPHSYFQVNIGTKNLNELDLQTEILPDPILTLSNEQVNFSDINFQAGIIYGYNKNNKIIILEENSIIGEIGKRHKELKVLNMLLRTENLNPPELEIIENEFNNWKINREEMIKDISYDEVIMAKVAETEKDGILDKNEIIEVEKILKRFNKVFARHDSDTGFSRRYVVTFDLNKEMRKSEKRAPYRNSSCDQNEIIDFLDGLEESGVIGLSPSSWTSPSIFIRKKNKKLRLVTNFKTWLNECLNGQFVA